MSFEIERSGINQAIICEQIRFREELNERHPLETTKTNSTNKTKKYNFAVARVLLAKITNNLRFWY